MNPNSNPKSTQSVFNTGGKSFTIPNSTNTEIRTGNYIMTGWYAGWFLTHEHTFEGSEAFTSFIENEAKAVARISERTFKSMCATHTDKKTMDELFGGSARGREAIDTYCFLECEGYLTGVIDELRERFGERQYSQEQVKTFWGEDYGEKMAYFFSNIAYMERNGHLPTGKDAYKYGFVVCGGSKQLSRDTFMDSMSKGGFCAGSSHSQICGVCSVPAKNKCAKCEKIYYCCRDHQVADWKRHKIDCSPVVSLCAGELRNKGMGKNKHIRETTGEGLGPKPK